MFTAEGLTQMAVSIGDHHFSGDGVAIKEFGITRNVNVDFVRTLGGQRFIQTSAEEIEISIRMTLTADGYEEFICEPEKKKIRDKKVKDCSVKELLFAARHKMSENKTH